MKFKPLCPHGQPKQECKTCTSARDYWQRFDWDAYYIEAEKAARSTRTPGANNQLPRQT